MTTKLALDGNAKPIPCLRPSTTQTVTVGGTSASSSVITGDVRVVRIMCDTDCFYELNGAATTSKVPLPASVIEFVHIYDRDYISFITTGTAGTAYITEMS